MKILIVDDNKAVRLSLNMLLAAEFDSVFATGDPKLLPALLREGDVDAVLLDMNFDTSHLDGSDGLFWLGRIKACPNPPAVVMITAFGDVPLAVEAMKAGADDFVTKPWDNEELIAKLYRAIDRNRRKISKDEAVSKAKVMAAHEQRQHNMTLAEIKMEHVRLVVESCGGNLKLAAEKLGITRQTLYNMLGK